MYPITRLGLPTQKVNQFKDKGIETLEDLVDYLPRDYHDFRTPKSCFELQHQEFAALIGTPQSAKEGTNYLSYKCKDLNGDVFYLMMFGNKHLIRKQCPVGKTLLFAGKWKVEWKFGSRMVSISNPPYCTPMIKETAKIHPVYRKLPKMSKDYLTSTIQAAVLSLSRFDYLEPELQLRWKVLPTHQAYRAIHAPTDFDLLERGYERIALDKLFRFAFEWQQLEPVAETQTTISFSELDATRAFMRDLPFSLTTGQKAVLKNMMTTIQSGQRLKTLVQGDVGSGKTLVATIMLMAAAENHYQAALLVPTQVLAGQHAKEITAWLEPFGLRVGFLSGELKAKERKELLTQLKNGEIDVMVGTHALLSDKVQFKNLGLVVVDEEHRFGVHQREKLQEQQKKGVHFISMSATPIPRTLASTMYGDALSVEVINTMPKGRKPIITRWVEDAEASTELMVQALEAGRQGYIISPFVKRNERFEGVMSVEEAQEWVQAHPKLSGYRTGILHGDMSADEIQSILWKFKAHELDLLIATTVVEVGVNVPNATHIMILNADRFGLAQLHQLRGRVGRGTAASTCDLIATTPSEQGRTKLEAMVASTDGFYLSRVDLELRGAGNLIGESQNGFESTFLLLLKYPDLYDQVKAEVNLIYQDAARLAHYRREWNLEDATAS